MSSPSDEGDGGRRDAPEESDPQERVEEGDGGRRDAPERVEEGDGGRRDAPERPDGGETAPPAESQWRFEVDDVGEDGVQRPPLEPGSVSLENAFFVAVGVLFTLGIALVALLP